MNVFTLPGVSYDSPQPTLQPTQPQQAVLSNAYQRPMGYQVEEQPQQNINQIPISQEAIKPKKKAITIWDLPEEKRPISMKMDARGNLMPEFNTSTKTGTILAMKAKGFDDNKVASMFGVQGIDGLRAIMQDEMQSLAKDDEGGMPKPKTIADYIAIDKWNTEKKEKGGIGSKDENSAQAQALADKAKAYQDVLNDPYLSSTAGANWMGRMSPGSIFTGGKQTLQGKIKGLTSKETLDTLLNLKAQGGTLGALSDSERIMLQNAASNLGAWEIKDDKGNGTGEYNVSEPAFRAELEKLRDLSKKAYERATGKSLDIGSSQNQLNQPQPVGKTASGLTYTIES